jgi:hypothetical protein
VDLALCGHQILKIKKRNLDEEENAIDHDLSTPAARDYTP